MDPALYDKNLEERDPEPFEVWEENLETIELFLMMSSQWNFTAMGSISGLNYTALESVIRLSGKNCDPERFAELQMMERAALPVLNSRED